MNRFFLALPLILATMACNGGDDRPEQIKKLRAIGVGTCAAASGAPTATCTHTVGQPSTVTAPQVFTLTIVAALPLGTTVDLVENFAEPGPNKSLSFAGKVTPDMSTAKYDDHGAFRIYTVQAAVPIPPETILPILPEPGFAKISYGVHLAGSAGDQKIEGNLLVYPAADPAQQWTAPTVDITDPTNGQAISGTKDIKGVLNAANGEALRVSWFVDDGKVTNHRAKETNWQTPGPGKHTLVLTARGLKSGAFGYKVVDVTVQ